MGNGDLKLICCSCGRWEYETIAYQIGWKKKSKKTSESMKVNFFVCPKQKCQKFIYPDG